MRTIKFRGKDIETGEYDIRISYVNGVWFIEYVFSRPLYGNTEPTYPETFTGDTLGEAVNKASNFFEANFGKYKLIG